MASLSSDSDRLRIEEDIQKIKRALEDWQSADQEIEDSDDEDALKITSPDGLYGGEHETAASYVLKLATEDAVACPKQESRSDEDLSASNDELIQMAVALNRAYQDIVVENLEMVQLLLEQNRERQKEIENSLCENIAKNSDDQKAKKRNLSSYGYPYFRDKDGLPPPLSYEAQCKKVADDPEPHLRPVKMWTNKEKDILYKAVHKDIIRQKIQPILNRKELDVEKLSQAEKDNDPEQTTILSERIKNHDEAIKAIKNSPLVISDDVDSYIDTIDWMKISTIDFNGLRRADECCIFWRNHLQPNVNSSKWTAEEDTKLAELAKEYDCCNWEGIARSLGTKRSAFQCLQRYQTKLNPCLQAGKWSAEEDAFLKEVVSSVRIGDTIPWEEVSYYMDNRSNEQCEERWQQLQTTYRYGRWTEEEDELLLEAVHRYGKEWSKVQEIVPNRTAQQCRERYVNTLSPGTKIGGWRYQEDKTLWLACQGQNAFRWTQIAATIPGRLDNACLQRYRMLQRFKHVEDILLSFPNGKEVVNRLLRKPPKLRNRPVQPEVNRELKLKNIRRRIEKYKGIIADEQKKIDLLNISTSPRTKKSVQYHKNKISEATKAISHALNRMERIENQRKLFLVPERLNQNDLLEDIAQALEDRKKGVYVPRPLLGMRGLTAMLTSLENQLRLKKLIQKRTQLTLRELPDSDVLNIDLASDSDLDRDGSIPTSASGSTHPSTSGSTHGSNLRKTVKLKLKQRRRQKATDEEPKICQEIFDIVRDYDSKLTAGKPKKTGPGITFDPDEKVNEKKVFKIFTGALNLDMEGAKNQAKKRLAELGDTSLDPQMETLRADLELFQKALGCNLADPESSEATRSSVSPGSNLMLQVLPRKALHGQAAILAYNLPPLPPTVSTLMGFRSLLLKRRQLTELSNKKLTIVAEKNAATSKWNAEMTKRQRLNCDETELAPPCVTSQSIQNEMSGVAKGLEHSCRTAQPDRVPSGSAVANLDSSKSKQRSEVQNVWHTTRARSTSSPDAVPTTASHRGTSVGQISTDLPSQARVMILKGRDLNPESVSRLLKSRGIIADPDKVRLQMCKRSELAERILANSGKVNSSMGRRIQSKRTRKKALVILRQTHDFQLLKARFRSLFLWPALLSTITVEPKDTLQAERQEQQQQQPSQKTQQPPDRYPGYAQESCQWQNNNGDEQSTRVPQSAPSPSDPEQQQEQQMEINKQDPEDGEDSEEGVNIEEDLLRIPRELLEKKPETREQALKKTKKRLTKRTRYACSHGKRFRKRMQQPRWVKEEQREKFRQAALKRYQRVKQEPQTSEECGSNVEEANLVSKGVDEQVKQASKDCGGNGDEVSDVSEGVDEQVDPSTVLYEDNPDEGHVMNED